MASGFKGLAFRAFRVRGGFDRGSGKVSRSLLRYARPVLQSL